MKYFSILFISVVAIISCSSLTNSSAQKTKNTKSDVHLINHEKNENMKLGAFSVSLNVKDLEASKAFYEHLGFSVFAGGLKMNYLIMKSEDTLIGLFQGMFPNNILTFNPGWDQDAKNVDTFDDIRAIHKDLKAKGLTIDKEIDSASGPANFTVTDPDGNVILFDQHR